jgi:hypothetical protein
VEKVLVLRYDVRCDDRTIHLGYAHDDEKNPEEKDTEPWKSHHIAGTLQSHDQNQHGVNADPAATQWRVPNLVSFGSVILVLAAVKIKF